MTDKPTRNYYKIACITVLIALQCVIIYHGVPSALDAFSYMWLEGMTAEQANCIAKHEELLEGLYLE